MRGALRCSSVVGAGVFLAGWYACQAPGQTITQTLALRSGWNAVYLEVQPPDPGPDVVFSNLPLASVWTHAERLTSATFIQDPSEEAFNRAGWLAWFPPQSPAAFLGNLHTVTGNRAYLLKNTNATTVNWVVTGRPASRRTDWVPDAFNLLGFTVDEANPPSFLHFFRYSSAHFDSASGQIQPIYRLGADGRWAQVNASDSLRRGEAIWVFSRGASDYAGPVEVRAESGSGLDFDLTLEELTLEFKNRALLAQPATLRLHSSTAPGALVRRVFDPVNGGYRWPALPDVDALSVPGNSTERLHFGVRRALFSGTFSALLEVNAGGQTTYLPVSASKLVASATKSTHSLQGLWVGGATVNAVNEVNRNPTNLTPVPAGFPLRLLLHIDSSGHARFLKEVLQMWRDGTYTNDASGNKIVDKPGEYVLLTDDRLIGSFKGATLRDGVPVGRRISTAGFDFDGGATNYLDMNGQFAVSNQLTLALTLGPNLPTNPFRHKYHPDHDNLDARFVALTNNFEAYPITREIALDFTASDPTGSNPADFGYSVMGGIYRETITGLHKNSIHLQGTFRLTRASYIGELNPSATP